MKSDSTQDRAWREQEARRDYLANVWQASQFIRAVRQYAEGEGE